jgi:phosphatidylserine/phosphatidylglycerophosphate/cardiolipin synthase-like enzyme
VDLRALAFALRAGRIAPPFSYISLHRLLGRRVDSGIAELLNTVGANGCGAEATALWLGAFADLCERRDAAQQVVQMVSTAPMGDSAMHRDTAVVVQDLFRRARRSLLISTYGIYGGREIFRNLATRMENIADLRVRMFLDIQEGGAAHFAEEFRRFHWPEQARLPDIYYDVRSEAAKVSSETAVMHAKCIVMDGEEVLVTSANFTEAAQHRNVELGLLVRSEPLARQVTEFFEGLISGGWCSLLRF